jgi:hypothetical protein
MSVQITTAFVNQYRSNVTFALQQKGSRLRPCVRVETQNAEFEFYDEIGATDAVEVLTRHSDTPLMSTPHTRRRVSLRDFDWADLVDKPDKVRTLIDPASPYAMNAVWAMGRKMDDLVFEAMYGTAYTGKTGATSVSFDTAMDIDLNYVESGSATDSGLTIGKLRKAKELLDAEENDPDEERFIAVTAKQVTDLLKTTEVTSSDYNTVKALVEGKIDTFMGFKFIKSQRVPTESGEPLHRRCPAWVRSGVLLAISYEIGVDISQRKDKRNSTQVYVTMGLGSTRMNEKKIVEIKCHE